MSFWMLLLVVVPGIMINRWLTAKEKAKKQLGFEVVKQPTGETPVVSPDQDRGGQ